MRCGSQSNPLLTWAERADRDIMSSWAGESAYACGRKAGGAKRAFHPISLLKPPERDASFICFRKIRASKPESGSSFRRDVHRARRPDSVKKCEARAGDLLHRLHRKRQDLIRHDLIG